MAGIKAPILDIMNRLQSLGVFAHIRIWNSQIDYERDGKIYDFPKPAAFVEVVSDPLFEQLGGGFQSADLAFRIHICDEEYDAGQGTFEQNVSVFDLRDAVCRPTGLSLYQPVGMGPLTKITEAQDYEHDNLYHYTVDFMASFIDSTGSPYDPENGQIIDGVITGVVINANVVPASDELPPQIPRKTAYRIPQ